MRVQHNFHPKPGKDPTMKSIKRRAITLVEIMIVIFLIALITGVVAYNYRGTLEEGKAFKTRAGIEKLDTIITLGLAEHPELADNIESNWTKIVEASPLIKNPKFMMKDGWGEQYRVTLEDGVVKIRSEKFEQYKKAHPSSFNNEE